MGNDCQYVTPFIPIPSFDPFVSGHRLFFLRPPRFLYNFPDLMSQFEECNEHIQVKTFEDIAKDTMECVCKPWSSFGIVELLSKNRIASDFQINVQEIIGNPLREKYEKYKHWNRWD